MLTGLVLVAAVLPAIWYGLARFERWSQATMATAIRRRAEESQIMDHPGANEAWAERLRMWRETDEAWREYES